MSPSEYAKCQQAAMLYRQAKKEIAKLRQEVAELRAELRQISKEDRDVFLLVQQNRDRFAK